MLGELEALPGAFASLSAVLSENSGSLREAAHCCSDEVPDRKPKTKAKPTPQTQRVDPVWAIFPSLPPLQSAYAGLKVSGSRLTLEGVTRTSFPSVIAKIFSEEFSSVLKPLVETTLNESRWSVQRPFLYCLGVSETHLQYAIVYVLIQNSVGRQKEQALFTVLDLQCWGLLGDIPACYDSLKKALSRVYLKWKENRDGWLKFYSDKLVLSKLPVYLLQFCALECDKVIPDENAVRGLIGLYSTHPFVVTCSIFLWLVKYPLLELDSQVEEDILSCFKNAVQDYPGLFQRILASLSRFSHLVDVTASSEILLPQIEELITTNLLDMNRVQSFLVTLKEYKESQGLTWGELTSLPLRFSGTAIVNSPSSSQHLIDLATEILGGSEDKDEPVAPEGLDLKVGEDDLFWYTYLF